jgi:hypothetical protein
MSLRCLAAIVLLGGARVSADVYSYECDVLPTVSGWTLLQAWCDPDEWIEGGRLFQRVEFCAGFDPPEGQQFDYRRSLEDFLGAETFFVEWRVETTGLRSELPFTAPASLVSSNGGGVRYHFTISRDQVRFIRNIPDFPILWPEIQPGVPHTYRVEQYGTDLYVVYIDGKVIDSGIPEGPHPAYDPRVSMRAKAQFVESTTVWDYIRWGVIAQDASGDYDSDGDVDGRDFYFFHECLANARLGINGGPGENAGPGCRFADFDADADVDLHDLAAFQNAFTGGD